MNKIIKLLLKLWKQPKKGVWDINFKTDLKPSPEDTRDNMYSMLSAPSKMLLDKVDLSEYCTPVKQQGNIGSCGSHAYCSAIELNTRKKDPQALIPLSELFHYYVVRDKDYMNTLPEDSGQTLRDGAKVCQKIGISPEKLCPYNPKKYNNKPGVFAYGFAKFFKISMYSRCWSVDAIKQSLSDGRPVIIGVTVQDSIFKTGKNGNITGTGKDIGGHALCVVGYDNFHVNPDKTNGALYFVNSWGINWGSSGYGWISYSLLRKKMIEAWTVIQE